MTSTPLVEFLRARLDEDERLARAVEDAVGTHRKGGTYDDGSGPAYDDAFPSYSWSHADDDRELRFMAGPGHPSRIRADVAAKRALIEEIEGLESQIDNEWGSGRGFSDGETALRFLAAPYASHPDFDPVWTVPDLPVSSPEEQQ